MNKNVFADLSVAGFLREGETYYLSEWTDNQGPDPIEYLYVIRTEEELGKAVIMEFTLLASKDWEIRKFVGVRKIKDDSYEFISLMYDIDRDCEFERSIYLYRLMSFEEKRKDMMELYKGLYRF